MEKIVLSEVLPDVFSAPEYAHMVSTSDVWLREITISRGCRTQISAASGNGKSSILAYIYGRRNDYLGNIFFDSKDIRTLPVSEWCSIRCHALAMLPQEPELFPELTARENVDIKNSLTAFRSEQWITDAFDTLGIADRMDFPAGRMSVGQQQRVAIIRTLCQPFDFLLLDEPVSHLDSDANSAVAELVETTATSLGAGIIVTSVGNPLSLSFTSHLCL